MAVPSLYETKQLAFPKFKHLHKFIQWQHIEFFRIRRVFGFDQLLFVALCGFSINFIAVIYVRQRRGHCRPKIVVAISFVVPMCVPQKMTIKLPHGFQDFALVVQLRNN